MQKWLSYSVYLLLSVFLVACEKKDSANGSNNNSSEIELAIQCPDTFIVAYDTIINLDVRGLGNREGKLQALWNNNNVFLTTTVTNQTFKQEDYARFPIKFDQFNVRPDIYYFDVQLGYEQLGMTLKEKRVYVWYKPTCAYEFLSYHQGNITYVSNQELVNKNINCTYSSKGNLLVDGLTPYTLEFTVNCATQDMTMKPVVHLGDNITGSARVVNNQVQYTLRNNGQDHASGIMTQ